MSADEINMEVCNFFGIEKIEHKSRKTEFLIPRMTAMKLQTIFTDLTQEQIARNFGKKCHSTVINAKISIDNLIFTNKNFNSKFNYLVELIKQKINEKPINYVI